MQMRYHLITTRLLEKSWRGRVLSERKATGHIASSAYSSLLVPVLWDNVSLSFFSLQRLLSRLTKSTPSCILHFGLLLILLPLFNFDLSESQFQKSWLPSGGLLLCRCLECVVLRKYCQLSKWVNEWADKILANFYSLREHLQRLPNSSFRIIPNNSSSAHHC